jgi:hypothetical protein
VHQVGCKISILNIVVFDLHHLISFVILMIAHTTGLNHLKTLVPVTECKEKENSADVQVTYAHL